MYHTDNRWGDCGQYGCWSERLGELDRIAREFDRLISYGCMTEDDAHAVASYLVEARLLLRKIWWSHGVVSETPAGGDSDEVVEYDGMITGLQGDLEIAREHEKNS
jgi:hypothetical protein